MRSQILALLLVFASGCAHRPAPRTADTTDAGALVARGRAALAAGDADTAVDCIETALLIDPLLADPQTSAELFQTRMMAGKYRLALSTAEDIARQAPDRATSYFYLGLAHLWLRHYRPSVAAFERALDFQSYPTLTRFYLGMAHGARGNREQQDRAWERAVEEYERILTANPRSSETLMDLARLLLLWEHSVERVGGLLETASQTLAGMEAAAPPHGVLRLEILQGIHRYRKGEPAAALAALTTAIGRERLPSRAELAEVYWFSAKAAEAGGKHSLGKTLLARARETDPASPLFSRLTR